MKFREYVLQEAVEGETIEQILTPEQKKEVEGAGWKYDADHTLSLNRHVFNPEVISL